MDGGRDFFGMNLIDWFEKFGYDVAIIDNIRIIYENKWNLRGSDLEINVEYRVHWYFEDDDWKIWVIIYIK